MSYDKEVDYRIMCDSWEEAKNLSLRDPSLNKYLRTKYKMALELESIKNSLHTDNIHQKNKLNSLIKRITDEVTNNTNTNS